jgi:hypothetical protein
MKNNTLNRPKIEITISSRLTDLQKAVLLALDDIAKPNETYEGYDRNKDYGDLPQPPLFTMFLLGKAAINCDEAGLQAYDAWIKQTSAHRFNLGELRKRIETDFQIAPFTADELKQAVLNMTTLSVTRTVNGKRESVSWHKLFDSIAIAYDEGEAYFSFGEIAPLIFGSNESDFKSFGRAIVDLKHTSERKR